jgi:ATP-dependent RNA helicase DDX21
VKEIGSNYQEDVLSIDITGQNQSRTATTVRHVAIQVPFGPTAKKDMLEDIIAVEISKDLNLDNLGAKEEGEEDEHHNAIAAAAKAAKSKTSGAFQQKLFGKTIVFAETKAECDELVSGGVFKTLTAQAIHGDIGQKQRDATLAAFRAGAFNVLVATDVAARGIDIKDVDLVIQFQPPRDNDTYVHRSGRTGRAGAKGISVLLFQQNQARDIVRIERSLGHGFKFDLQGPPSSEAALNAAAKTSAIACQSVADETAEYFKEAASSLLANSGQSPEDVVSRCLAAIARRTVQVESRSLLTGESGFATVEMTNSRGRNVSPGDVMFTVGKLAKMSREEGGDLVFDSEIGKIQTNYETGSAMFDMGVEDAKKLLEFSKDIDAGGAEFSILKEMEINRGRNFGAQGRGGRGGRGGGRGSGGRGGGRGWNSGGYNDRRGGYNDRRGGYNDGYGGGRGGGRFNRYEGGGRRNNYDDGYGGGRRSYSSGPRPTRNSGPRRPRSNEW